MRFILIVVLIAASVYWLSGQGILNFDNVKAKRYINSALDKIDSKSTKNGRALREVPNVDNEVGRLCTELKDLSDRAMRLRQRLLANVVESTDPERVASKTRSSRYSRR